MAYPRKGNGSSGGRSRYRHTLHPPWSKNSESQRPPNKRLFRVHSTEITRKRDNIYQECRVQMTQESEFNSGIFQSILGPWREALGDPASAQRRVLTQLLESYRKTAYGENHHASGTTTTDEYRRNFSTIDYKGLNPYLGEIRKGNYSALLPEPLICWVMTRGSTGPAKVLPATKTHLGQIFSCGARALINHALRKKDFQLLSGKILNLNFPSNVHS